MPQWYDITRKAGYQDLTPEDQSAVKQRFFERYVLPEIDSHPDLQGDEDARKAAYIKFMQTPDDTGQGIVTSTLGGVARGFGEIVPGAIQGAGALTGIEPLERAGESVRSGLEYVTPVNPLYQESFPVKAGGVVGQIGSVLATAGVGGAVGKGLAAERIAAGTTAAERALAASQAVSRGANTSLYGSAGLQGAASGAQTADQYGLTGANRYGNVLAGSLIEMGTELLPFGLGAETAAAKKLLGVAPRAGRFAGAVGSEAGEEFTGQVAQNAALASLAPTGTETPGLMEGAVEAGLYGGLGGGILGGVNLAAGAYNKPVSMPETLPQVQEAISTAEASVQEAAAAGVPVSATAQALAEIEKADTSAFDFAENLRRTQEEGAAADIQAAQMRAQEEYAAAQAAAERQAQFDNLTQNEQPLATAPVGGLIPETPSATVANLEAGSGDSAMLGIGDDGRTVLEEAQPEAAGQAPSQGLAGTPALIPDEEAALATEAPRITELARQAAAIASGAEKGADLGFEKVEKATPPTSAADIEQLGLELDAIPLRGRGLSAASNADNITNLGARIVNSGDPDLIEAAKTGFNDAIGFIKSKSEGAQKVKAALTQQVAKLRQAQISPSKEKTQKPSQTITGSNAQKGAEMPVRRQAGEAIITPTTEKPTSIATEGQPMSGDSGSVGEKPVSEMSRDEFNRGMAKKVKEATAKEGVMPKAEEKSPEKQAPSEKVEAGKGDIFGRLARDAQRKPLSTQSERQRALNELTEDIKRQIGNNPAEIQRFNELLDLPKTNKSIPRIATAFLEQADALVSEQPATMEEAFGQDMSELQVGDVVSWEDKDGKVHTGAILSRKKDVYQIADKTQETTVRLPRHKLTLVEDVNKASRQAAIAETVNSVAGGEADLIWDAVSVNDGLEALARLHNSGQFPGLLNAFVGTTKEFAEREKNNPDPYYRSIIALINHGAPMVELDGKKRPNVAEGYFFDSDGRSILFTDKTAIAPIDKRIAEFHNVPPAVAASMRVLMHEGLGHRGWWGLPESDRAKLTSMVKAIKSPEDFDRLAKLYPQYADWAKNADSESLLVQEFISKIVESLRVMPKDGPIRRLIEYLQEVWQKYFGKKKGTLSMKELRLFVEMLQAGSKAPKVELVNGGGIKMSQLRAQGFVTPEMDAEYMAAVESGDVAKQQELVDKARMKPRTVFYVGKAEVIRNPNDSDYRQIKREHQEEYPNDKMGETTRFTMDKNGNRYIWRADYGMHNMIEPGIESRENVTVGQNEFNWNMQNADPVNRDRGGNVIPLSQRFNPAKADIRESRISYANPLDAQLASAAERMRAMREKQVPQEVETSLDDVKRIVNASLSREEVEPLLKELNTDEVKDVVRSIGYPTTGTKADNIKRILSFVGSRADAIAIRGENPTIRNTPTIVRTPEQQAAFDEDRRLENERARALDISIPKKKPTHNQEEWNRNMAAIMAPSSVQPSQIRNEIRKAYDFAIQGQGSVQASLQQVYDIAKAAIPTLTEKQFGEQVQALYEDGSAFLVPTDRSADMLAAGEKWGVFDVAGLPASYIGVMPSQETNYGNDTNNLRPRGTMEPRGGAQEYGGNTPALSPNDKSPRANTLRAVVDEAAWRNLSPEQKKNALDAFGAKRLEAIASKSELISSSYRITRSLSDNAFAALLPETNADRLVVEISPTIRPRHKMLNKSALEAYAFMYDMMQEEIIHFAQHYNAWQQWVNGGAKGSINAFEREHFTNQLRDVYAQRNAAIQAGNSVLVGKIDSAIVNAWNLYDPSRQISNIGQLQGALAGADVKLPEFMMELTRQLVQINRQDFTTETGWAKFRDMLIKWANDVRDALRNVLSSVRGGEFGQVLKDEIASIERIVDQIERGDGVMPSQETTKVYATPIDRNAIETEIEKSSKAPITKDLLEGFILRTVGMYGQPSRVRMARLDMDAPLQVNPQPNGELVIGLGARQAGEIIRNSRSQKAGFKYLADAIEEEMIHFADLLAMRTKWEAQGSNGSFTDFIRRQAMEIKASRVENTQVPKAIDSTKGFADAIDAIKTASPTMVESQARALKDHLPDDFIQQGVEPRVAVSIALIDRLLKSGIPAIELPSILNSPAFLDSLGISENADMQQYLAIEALNRINLAAADADNVTDRNALVRQADGAAKIWNLLGEFGGRSLGTRGWLMKHPRYAAMFVEQGILSNLANQSDNVTKANIVDPNAVVKGAEKAAETANEAATNQSDEDLVDSWMEAAKETLSPKAKGLFDRIREKLARIGYLMGLNTDTKQSVAGNLAARFAQEYKGITKEKIESELAKLRKEVEADLSSFADELLGKDAPQEAKTKVKKTAEKAAKREKKKKPTAEDRAKKKQERANAIAQRLIYRTEEVFRQGFKNEAKSKNADSILKAFRDQVKEPVSDAAFTARVKKLNVTEEVAARMLKTAARERGDQEQIKKNALLDSAEALKKLMYKLSGKLGIFQIDPTSWRKLFSTSKASQEQRKVEMQEAIKADPAFSKLDEDEQKQLADLLDEAWQAKHDEVLKTEINRLTRTNKMSDKAKDAINDAIPEIIQMVNRGTFDNAELAKIVSAKFGFRDLTAEERGRLREITEKLQQDIPPWEHKRLANELRELLADVTNLNFAELAEAWWVSSVLSGPRTAFTIGLGFNSGGFEVIKNSLGTILLNPTNPNAWDASFKAIKGWLSSMPREAQRALAYLKTGDVTLLDSSMSNDAALIDRAVKELGSVGVAAKLLKSKNPVARKAGQFMAFMQKLLQALDMFNGYTAKYAGMPLAYFQTQSVYDPKELDTIRNHALSRQQVLNSEFGGVEPTSFEDKARLNAWATDKMWKDIQRLGSLEENANYLAQQANMTLNPTGVGGIFYHTILGIQASQKKKSADFVQKQKEELLNADGIEKQIAKFNLALGYMYQFAAHNFLGALGLKFARFGGSKLNQTLSFIPLVGLTRLAEKTDAQKMHMINVVGAQALGFMILGQALWVLSKITEEPDDDERGWDIQGNWGNVSPERKQQLLAAGKREYTIFYKGKRYSYANWPISGMLSAIGSMADLIRYSPDQWNEKSVANRLASGVWAAAASVGDSAALSQLSELLGTSMASRDPIEASMGKFNRVFGNYAGGFIPRILKDVDLMQNPKINTYKTLWERLAKEVPVARRFEGKALLDVFAKQVAPSRLPWSRELVLQPPEPEYQKLGQWNNNGIWLSPPNARNRMVGKGRHRRPMTEMEADRYIDIVGNGYRDMVLKYGDRVLSMPKERAKAFVSDKADEIRDRASKKAVKST